MKFAQFAPSREGRGMRSSPQLQRPFGKQSPWRSRQSNAEGSQPSVATAAAKRFDQDFSRLPLVSPARDRFRAGSPVDAPRSMRGQTSGHFADPASRVPGVQHRFDDLESDTEPMKSGPTKCPEFVSLTAKGKDPELRTLKGRCRFRLGTCTTKRGTCGNTGDSGMAFEGKVKTAAGCTGKLAFMQNILSTDRKVTLADGTKECISVSSAHHDGGPPWKGCSLDVTTAGTHEIKSDDCPGRSLHDHPSDVSISDSFKLYLMWKAGEQGKWKPIANATWGWSGAVKRKSGAKDTDECTKRYEITSKSHTDGTGSASTDMPVASPKIEDVKPGPCK